MIDARAALAVALRPRLWAAAVVLVLRLAPRGWWRRWPPVPSPSPAYAAFRVHTALGGPTDAGSAGDAAAGAASPRSADRPDAGEARLGAEEVVAFLEWCRRMGVWRRSA